MSIDAGWESHVEHLSQLCKDGSSSTHIAFLGTAMLAKSMASAVDLFAIKPTHAVGNPNAYSARTLCHSVLVPLAAEFGISIGVTGREPLNNQPYFRMTRLGDATPVHSGGKAAFDYMVGLVKKLQDLKTVNEARDLNRQLEPGFSINGVFHRLCFDFAQRCKSVMLQDYYRVQMHFKACAQSSGLYPLEQMCNLLIFFQIGRIHGVAKAIDQRPLFVFWRGGMDTCIGQFKLTRDV